MRLVDDDDDGDSPGAPLRGRVEEDTIYVGQPFHEEELEDTGMEEGDLMMEEPEYEDSINSESPWQGRFGDDFMAADVFSGHHGSDYDFDTEAAEGGTPSHSPTAFLSFIY